MQMGETITLKRDTMAALIPAGSRVIIPEGTEVSITQAMGGSYTVYVSGNLARIEGEDADALGYEPTSGPELPEDATDEQIEEVLWDQMRMCYDPEIPVNIVDLGLIYDCRVSELEDGNKRIDVKMTLTAPGCGMGDILAEDVRSKLEKVPSVAEANVEMVFDPPWSTEMMSDSAKLQLGMM